MFPSAARAQYQTPDAAFAAPATYYSPATGTGTVLKAQLNGIIDGHTIRNYSSTAVNALEFLDQDPNNAANLILVYSGYSVAKSQFPGGTVNREHLWPNSYGIDDANPANSDLFNLRPCDATVNSTRNNNYFDDGGVSPGHPEAPETRIVNGTSWEPRAIEKGDLARSMFYMDTRYEGDASDGNTSNLTLVGAPLLGTVNGDNANMGNLGTLLRWHYQDGVSNVERRRNHLIYTSATDASGWSGGTAYNQGNRNPYIDHPEWVWAVFGGGNNNSKLYVGSGSAPASGASSTTANLRVITGAASWGSASVTLNKAGTNPTTFDVTISGAATSTNAGVGQTIDYNPGTRAIQVSLNGPVGMVGATVSGTVTVDNTDITSGGAGLGADDGNDTINVTGTVLDHAQPSFVLGGSASAQSIDFGYVPASFASRTANFALSNNAASAGPSFTAGLDVDGVTRSGSAAMSTNVTASNPAAPLPAGESRTYIANFTPGASQGLVTATHTIANSDENIPGATARPNLVLTTSGRVTTGDFPVSGDLFLFGNETFDTTSFSVGDGQLIAKLGPGTMNIHGPQSHGASAQLVAAGGPVNFFSDANSTASSGLTVSAWSAPVTFHSTQHLKSLESSGRATVAPNGANTLVLGEYVETSPSATLDLKDNALIIRGASGATAGTADTAGVYDGVQALVQRGYENSAWSWTGIVTTTQQARDGLTTLAVARAAEAFNIAATAEIIWRGETISGGDVVTMYTYAGDLNFDGRVDAQDYGVIDNWVQFPGTDGYVKGDINYDGVIDAIDYGIIDNTIQLQGSPIGTSGIAGGDVMGGLSAVPEPAALVLAVIAAAPLLARRRRRARRARYI
jgi:endonuclease I